MCPPRRPGSSESLNAVPLNVDGPSDGGGLLGLVVAGRLEPRRGWGLSRWIIAMLAPLATAGLAGDVLAEARAIVHWRILLIA